MILRKPYALFIKYFKIMHLVISALIIYSIYKIGFLYSFFGERISHMTPTVGLDLTGTLFDIYLLAIPFIIILISVVILSVLIFKKKPYKFYIILIVVYIAVFFLNNYVYSVLGELENKMMGIRDLRFVRDLLTFSLLAQFLVVIKTVISGTGFDIKKFDFRSDLEELDITEIDREEFEFEVNIDPDKARRKVRHNLRFIKYYYIENMVFVNMCVLIFTAFVSFSLYFNQNIYNKMLYEGNAFFTSTGAIRINNSYITNKDYLKNNINKNYSLLVVNISVRSNFSKTMLETARTQIEIGGSRFLHTDKYRDKLFDIGKVYTSIDLKDTFEDYILVYEIPNRLVSEEILFKYTDSVNYIKGEMRPSIITVSLKPNKIDKKDSEKNFTISDSITMDNFFAGTKLKLNSLSIDKKMFVEYNFCPRVNDCYTSKEYINANYVSSIPMGVMKIEADFIWHKDINHLKYSSLGLFLKDFGYIIYNDQGVVKKYKINTQIDTFKVKTNSLFIEVPLDVINSSSAELVIETRGTKYLYKIK